eukprot:CAMPEP_0175058326 /NCGR_PEP_ID=MMETSP0052_2-20121109/11788_1 /TAXON_ID=51329 ORGANISM="Polytomella parva, Strain SAG 63-3" /NCGR_SAMPLE_ID=MMETSP0052_2 /ASSEMBLY_ACC=CAM_ASM_000194 /LENGTH=490 /DNA_ID=CAMNT_0016323699 /DNA_START=232 /DNA_END=1704 /DNA_ORIENTATION=+
MSYHAARKPPSVVKSVLRGDSAMFSKEVGRQAHPHPLTGWAPFNGDNGESLLGEVDLAFLGTYAIGMFFSGHICDQVDLRSFLTIGMVGSGICVILHGLGYFLNCHYLLYYLIVSVLGGLFQSTGWPSVVSAVANWCGKGKRGLVMGVWNVHTSLGNILGTMVAAWGLSAGWGWSFAIPGVILLACAVLVYLFLIGHPDDLNSVACLSSDANRVVVYSSSSSSSSSSSCAIALSTAAAATSNCNSNSANSSSSPSASSSLHPNHPHHPHRSVRFIDAWRIPGVASYAFCLFFAKLVAYTFLYWLPFYIRSAPIAEHMLSAKEAGELSTLFDVGGVMGGILAGHLSDRSGASAAVACSFTLLSVPCLYLYRTIGHSSYALNAALLLASGFFVNGPYALITTAVSADLGTHESLQGCATALATVSAIIDGMGSLGAALGPMLTGIISSSGGGFDMVFAMLYTSAAAAGALLVRLVAREIAAFREAGFKKDFL